MARATVLQVTYAGDAVRLPFGGRRSPLPALRQRLRRVEERRRDGGGADARIAVDASNRAGGQVGRRLDLRHLVQQAQHLLDRVEALFGDCGGGGVEAVI